jgi:mannose-6-phosphate isomerase
LAEIQQTSDVTYRIYDFERKDADGNFRELHTELAVDAIDYNFYSNYKSNYKDLEDIPSELVSCKYFTTNKLNLNSPINKNIHSLDSFIIYMCLDGTCDISYYEKESVILNTGESILIPASLSEYTLNPSERVELLEVYIPQEKDKE